LTNGSFPANLEDLEKCEVIYETLPGWESDISNITEYSRLPPNCRKYVERVEELIGIPVTWIGTGPDRKNTIMKPL
jgi:adenylosuccinate synthase